MYGNIRVNGKQKREKIMKEKDLIELEKKISHNEKVIKKNAIKINNLMEKLDSMFMVEHNAIGKMFKGE